MSRLIEVNIQLYILYRLINCIQQDQRPQQYFGRQFLESFLASPLDNKKRVAAPTYLAVDTRYNPQPNHYILYHFEYD